MTAMPGAAISHTWHSVTAALVEAFLVLFERLVSTAYFPATWKKSYLERTLTLAFRRVRKSHWLAKLVHAMKPASTVVCNVLDTLHLVSQASSAASIACL